MELVKIHSLLSMTNKILSYIVSFINSFKILKFCILILNDCGSKCSVIK
jgi:hypothetical protein